MTTRLKTTRFAFATNTSTVATNTTLAGATRFDFTAITLYIPEATRTIKQAWAVFTFTGNNTTASDFDGVRLGMKVGAAAFVDVDTTFSAVHTGENETLWHTLDFTSNLVTNLGAGSSVALQAGIAVAQGAAHSITAVTCEVYVTYEYDDASTTQIKTIIIPLQSNTDQLTATYAEAGTTDTTPCPANQIPQLTGGGGFLDESTITIRDRYIVLSSRSNPAALTTAAAMEVRLDGSTTLTRSTYAATLSTSVKVYDIIDQSLMPSAGAAHALELRSTVASRFWGAGGWMVVTYEYDHAASTLITNSEIVPMENAKSPLIAGNSDTTNNTQQFRARLNIQEPGTITMKQSGTVTYIHGQGANTRNISAPGQTARPYRTVATNVEESESTAVHRCDHSSSGWSALVVRGVVELAINYSSSNSAGCPVPTYAIVNYSSGKSAQGAGAHNHTVWYLHKQFEGTAIVLGRVTPTAPAIPEASYLLSGVTMLLTGRLTTSDFALRTERLSGEDNGAGIYYVCLGAGGLSSEIGCKTHPLAITQWFRGASHHSRAIDGADIEASRSWTFDSQGGSASYQGMIALTYSTNTFTVAGTVTNNGSPIAAGTVEIYAKDIDGKSPSSELIGTATTDGAGAFTFTTTDNTRDYFASYTNGTTVHGRSKVGNPTTNTFDITIGGAGGSITGIIQVVEEMPPMRKNESVADDRIAGPMPFWDNDNQLLTGQTFTAASSEVQIWNKTSGVFANASSNAVEVASKGLYYVQLSQAETNFGGFLIIKLSKATYADRYFKVPLDTSMVAKAVWDALPASHTVAGSFGELVANPTGAVVTDAGNTASTFKTNLASTDNDAFKDAWCCFLSGALVGQVHKVTGYNGTTKFLTFNTAFTGAPANTDRFVLINK